VVFSGSGDRDADLRADVLAAALRLCVRVNRGAAAHGNDHLADAADEAQGCLIRYLPITPFHLRMTSSTRFRTMASTRNAGQSCVVEAMKRRPGSNTALGS